MKNNIISFIVAVFIIGVLVVEFFAPSVDSMKIIGKEKQPSWHFGEGLKSGDSFEYKICDSLLRVPESPDNCYVITLDVVALLPSPQGNVWIMSAHVDHRIRNVDFILQVSDSSFEMITDGSSITYADSLERTLEWAIKFASNHKPQPLVIGKSWGVVASDTVPETKLTVMRVDSVQIGEEILPTYRIGYSLVQDSFLQIQDGFPMPIKAVIYKPVSVFKDVPLAMTFELLNYTNGVEDICAIQTTIIPTHSNPAPSDKSSMPNLPQKTESLVNFTGLDNAASKNTTPSKGSEEYDQLLDKTNLDNSSNGNYSDIETEYFDEADFRDKLKNSTTAHVLKDLYGPDYEKIITSFDKFVELLTNTTNTVKNQLNSTLP
ncbi:MAG: hypothetical protein HZA84_05905 [Thaumarchaeota archaeon]|nr:hypothetical protein [Nitrososphaerota archaeon]